MCDKNKSLTNWVDCKWCNVSYHHDLHEFQENGRPLTVESLLKKDGTHSFITKICRVCKGYGSVIIENGSIKTLDMCMDMNKLKIT